MATLYGTTVATYSAPAATSSSGGGFLGWLTDPGANGFQWYDIFSPAYALNVLGGTDNGSGGKSGWYNTDGSDWSYSDEGTTWAGGDDGAGQNIDDNGDGGATTYGYA